MQELAQNNAVQSVLLFLPTNTTEPQPDIAPLYRRAARETAARYGSLVIDMDDTYDALETSEKKDRFLDVVHPNVSGHTDIAQHICKALSSTVYAP